MPQNKVQIPKVGIWGPLRGYILPIVSKYPDEAKAIAATFPTETTEFDTGRKRRTPDAEVIEEIVKMLAVIAAEPLGFTATKCTPPGWFHCVFSTAPELTLAVMTEARKRWHGDKRSKGTLTQQIYQWLACCDNPWHDMENFKPSEKWPKVREEGDLAFAFAKSGRAPEPNTAEELDKLIGKFERARAKLVRHIREGEAFRL
jgi:hypothetical protein